MRRTILFALAAATAFALAAGTFTSEAAKRSLSVSTVSLVDGGDCVGTVTWTGLKGGKALDIRTRLAYDDGTSVIGATETFTVRQGVGQLVVNYGTVPFATDTSLNFEATFETRDGDVTVSAHGTCVP
jgi:hypothetical protein